MFIRYENTRKFVAHRKIPVLDTVYIVLI